MLVDRPDLQLPDQAGRPEVVHERRRGRETAGRKRQKEAASTGSHGIGFGGLDAKSALFWAFVGIPLAWGVWITLISAAKIF